MVKLASAATRMVNSQIPIVLGGILARDGDLLALMRSYGAIEIAAWAAQRYVRCNRAGARESAGSIAAVEREVALR